ncbi:MAG TPA: hypothetical protein VHG32_07750 [Thermoanaerobaculia bacterium]|nr:hypothetical protein [Thermoanaerobaculia bacterium]
MRVPARAFLARRLRSAALPWQLALLAMALASPALEVGWQLDDHFQRLAMLGRAPGVRPHEIFSVLDGDPARTAGLVDQGLLPWWTARPFRLSFCRPLAVASLWLDYRLWPDAAPLMHLHSLLWCGAMVAAAAFCYRRLSGSRAEAGLAALLFAVEDGHALPAAWLANRNSLLATLFGLLALAVHDRWRRDGWRPGAWWGPAFLALALLSGELGLGVLAYLAAYALLLDPAGWRRGLTAAIPVGGVFLTWAAAYRLLGFGASGSGMYLDPLASPAEALRAAGERLPLLLFGEWTALPAELHSLLPAGAARALWLASLVLALLLAVLFLTPLRRDRLCRFWALGMGLSLLPAVATLPANRLLMFTGLGAVGLLARLVAAACGASGASGADRLPPGSAAPAALTRAAAVLLAGVHLLLGPLLTPVVAANPRVLGARVEAAVASIPGDAAIAGQDLVIVDAPDFLLFVNSLPVIERLRGKPVPRRVRALTASPVALTIARIDVRTLRIAVHGAFFGGTLGRLFRADGDPLRAGQLVRMPGLTVEVAAVGAGGSPSQLVYRFDVPLEDPSLRWVRWADGRYVPFVPPTPGAAVELPVARGPFEELWGSRRPDLRSGRQMVK